MAQLLLRNRKVLGGSNELGSIGVTQGMELRDFWEAAFLGQPHQGFTQAGVKRAAGLAMKNHVVIR